MPEEISDAELESVQTPAPQQESPSAEEANLTAHDETEAEQPTPEGEDSAEEDDDSEDFEWNGKTYRVPRELKASHFRVEDYTRKTQELSAEKQTVSQRAQALDQWFQQADAELDLRADLKRTTADLEAYSKLTEEDWRRWEAEDFIAAGQGFRQFQQLQGKYAQIAQQLNGLQAQRSEQAKSETTTRLQETREYAMKNIKGWTPQVDEDLQKFATEELGFSMDDLRRQINKQTYRALYLAYVGQKALSKQPAKPQTPKAEPLKTVGAKANPPSKKSWAEMSMAETAEAFRKEKEAAGR